MTLLALGAIRSDAWIETIFSGFALGAKYALVALGFVVVFKATGVINFAQGGFVMVGAYLTYQFGTTWGLPFAVAVVLHLVRRRVGRGSDPTPSDPTPAT